MKKGLLTLTTVAVVGLSSAFFGDVAFAETEADLENEKANIEQEREDIKKDLSKAEAEIADVLIDIDALKNEIKELETAKKENTTVLKETEEDIEKHVEEIEALEEDIEELEESIEQRNEILKDRISSYQQNGGNISFLDVLFGSDSFGDFISRVSAVTTITSSDQQLMEELEADKEKIEGMQDEVEEKLTEEEELKEELKEYEVVLKGQKEATEEKQTAQKEKEKELKKVAADLETEDSDLSSLEASVASQLRDARSGDAETEVASSESSDSNGGDLSTLSEETPKEKSKSKEKAPTQSVKSDSVIEAAQSQLSLTKGYVFGGKNPEDGFDCSGFVSWAYGQTGKSIPSTTSQLRSTGTKVSYAEAQAGDLIFFTNPGGTTDGHVGMYLGNGKFIGSQSSTGVAIVDLNSNSYWNDAFKGHVRRVN